MSRASASATSLADELSDEACSSRKDSAFIRTLAIAMQFAEPSVKAEFKIVKRMMAAGRSVAELTRIGRRGSVRKGGKKKKLTKKETEEQRTRAAALVTAHYILNERNGEVVCDTQLRLLREAVAFGSALAAMQLGAHYLHSADHKKAVEYYTIAAKKGHPLAEHKLGYFYDEGLGRTVRINKEKAKKWYLKAVNHGNADSMNNLGGILEDAGNLSEALAHYQMGAELGNAYAQFSLGKFYSVQQVDDAKAWKYLNLSAAQNNAQALFLVALKSAVQSTPEYYDLERAARMMLKAAKLGDEQAPEYVPRILGLLAQNRRQKAKVHMSDKSLCS